MPTHPALDRYRDKRDFARTPEPSGDGAAASSGVGLSFVIQKHAATRLHYDFRLEWGGVLLSWAVPKGPSLDPMDKRMAVRTEDHPLAYGSFEGTIPPKQYGAGHVIVWDRGTWVPTGDVQAGLMAGKLAFELKGDKLLGLFELVRLAHRNGEKETWLLFKKRDAHARPRAEYDVVAESPDSVMQGTPVRRQSEAQSQPSTDSVAIAAPLPKSMTPQLAQLATEVPAKGHWIYETKYDGYRLMARIQGGQPRLITRGGHDWTDRLLPIAHALAELHIGSAWLDGEIIVPTETAGPGGDFNALQTALDKGGSGNSRIQYVLFDVPYFEGHDLRGAPLYARRALLDGLLSSIKPPLCLSAEAGQGSSQLAAGLLQEACAAGHEGLIAKQTDAPYKGTRSGSWLKLKCHLRQEFVICGYTVRSDDASAIGSLLLGVYEADGRSLRSAGNVGTGWNMKTARALLQRLRSLARKGPPFETPVPGGRRIRNGAGTTSTQQWVEPTLVAEIRFAQWTPANQIRHASFLALRDDKAPRDVVHEEANRALSIPARAASAQGPTHRSKAMQVTHGERVIDVHSGLTKLDLVRYYERIAPAMLPHLKGRPVALVRGPTGVGGSLFFQKHVGKTAIAGLVQLDPDLWPGHDALLEITTAEALVSAAQMNVIEFHTWNSVHRTLAKPDRMIFDLDPGEGVTWAAVQQGAVLTRALLTQLGLQSWLKTSGGKGLHVVVPIAPRRDFDTVKAFSKAVVEHLCNTLPQYFVAKSGPTNRVGKIFVDYLRNGEGATTVTAFSARARPGMGVSMPMSWEGLDDLPTASHWHVGNAVDAWASRNVDPWADMAGERQLLTSAMDKLDFKAPSVVSPQSASSISAKTSSLR